MKTKHFFGLCVMAAFTLVSCETPPPGTVVFNGKDNPDEPVMEYHGISEDDLEGHKVIKIETQSVRNPQDSTAVYAPRLGSYANFQ